MELQIDRIQSPIGELVIVVDGRDLCALDYADHSDRLHHLLQRRYKTPTFKDIQNPNSISQRLSDYFAGQYDSLQDVAVKPGGTPFQQQVWQVLRTIPPGTVCSYGEIATQLGNPNASRAVGLANSRNPIAIVIPCHRVIGTNSTLTGYAGGLPRKEWLLRHEGVMLSASSGAIATSNPFSSIQLSLDI